MAGSRHAQRLLSECLEAFGQIEILPVNPQTIAELEAHYQQFKHWASSRRQGLRDPDSKVSERAVVSLLRRLRKQLAALKPTHHGLAQQTTAFYSDSSSSEYSDDDGSTPGARPLRRVAETLALLYELVPAGTASDGHETSTPASLHQEALRAKAAQLAPIAEQALSILFAGAQPYLPKRLAAGVTDRSLSLFNQKTAGQHDGADSAVAEFGSACYRSIDSLMRLVITDPTTLDSRRQSLTDRPLPPPDGAQCRYCFCPITNELQDPHLWTAHVLADMRPYMCVHEDCSDAAERFSNRDEWVTHLQWSHNAAWICPFTGHGSRTFTAAEKFERHIQVRHGNQCTKNQRQLLQQSCYRPFRHPFSRDTIFTNAQGVASLCPFCTLGLNELESAGGDVVSDDASIRERAENSFILSHVARHMELVALLSAVEPAHLDSAGGAGTAPVASQRRKTSTPNSKKPRTRATSSPTPKHKPPSRPPAIKAPSPPVLASTIVDLRAEKPVLVSTQRPRASSQASNSSGSSSPRPAVPPVPNIPAQFMFPAPPRNTLLRGAPTPPSSPRHPGDDYTAMSKPDASPHSSPTQAPGRAISKGLYPPNALSGARSRSHSPLPLSPPPDRAIPAIPTSAAHHPAAILPASPPPDRLPPSAPLSPPQTAKVAPPSTADETPPSTAGETPPPTADEPAATIQPPTDPVPPEGEAPTAPAPSDPQPNKTNTPSRFKKTLAAFRGNTSTKSQRAPPPAPIRVSPAPPSRASQTPPMLSPASSGNNTTLLDFLREKWAEENAIDEEDRKGMAQWPGL